MKNTAVKILLIITIISSIFLCALLFLMLKGNDKGEYVSKLEEFQNQYDERNTDTKTIAPTVYQEFSKFESVEKLYDTENHKQTYERIEALKRDGVYTQDAPLVIYNPYGVNAQSVYVYFKTMTPVKVSYRISVQEEGIPTFTAKCVSDLPYSTEHEYLLIGLSAEQSNRISLVLDDEAGNSSVRTFYVTAGSLFGTGQRKLSVAKGNSEAALSDGLFAHFGNVTGQREAIQLYDNGGVMRSEYPLISGSGKRLIFFEDKMYFNCSDTQFAVLNKFGQAERVYTIDGYRIGADYCLDETQKKLLVLASKAAEKDKTASVNDRLLSIDLLSGEVKEVLDMGALLNEYKTICRKNEEGVLDWIGLNSVQMWEEGNVLLGSRESSAAFKVKDIYGIPMLDYIIGDAAIWAETGYEDLLLMKLEEFEGFAGANTFTCVKEGNMPSGVYYLYLYDNHIAGTESRPELDYSAVASELGSSLKKGTSSYFCRYMVNETARTWELLEQIPVDYSGYYGSAQLLADGHLITDTAGRFAYSEYDADRNLICKFNASGTEYLTRVLKYDFEGFYFAGE